MQKYSCTWVSYNLTCSFPLEPSLEPVGNLVSAYAGVVLKGYLSIVLSDAEYSTNKSVMSQTLEMLKLWDLLKYLERSWMECLLAKNEHFIVICWSEILALLYAPITAIQIPLTNFVTDSFRTIGKHHYLRLF